MITGLYGVLRGSLSHVGKSVSESFGDEAEQNPDNPVKPRDGSMVDAR